MTVWDVLRIYAGLRPSISIVLPQEKESDESSLPAISKEPYREADRGYIHNLSVQVGYNKDLRNLDFQNPDLVYNEILLLDEWIKKVKSEQSSVAWYQSDKRDKISKLRNYLTSYYGALLRHIYPDEADSVNNKNSLLLKKNTELASNLKGTLSEKLSRHDWYGSEILLTPTEDSIKVEISGSDLEIMLIVEDSTIQSIDSSYEPDDDSFSASDEQVRDYYTLLKVLTGGSNSAEKVITVYTARPVSDRTVYENASEIPSGIFVTTDYSKAIGYQADYHINRDVWKIRIQQKYLIPGATNSEFSVSPSDTGKIPVRSTKLVDQHHASTQENVRTSGFNEGVREEAKEAWEKVSSAIIQAATTKDTSKIHSVNGTGKEKYFGMNSWLYSNGILIYMKDLGVNSDLKIHFGVADSDTLQDIAANYSPDTKTISLKLFPAYWLEGRELTFVNSKEELVKMLNSLVPNIKRAEASFIHEYTHYLDYNRFKGDIKDTRKVFKKNEEYVNDPLELHALTQDIITTLESFKDRWKDLTDKQVIEGMLNPNSPLLNFVAQWRVKFLTEENKRRIKKNLYLYLQTRKKQDPNYSPDKKNKTTR